MGEAGDARSVTAALIVIGDEVLSGRTKDKNIGHIAERLTDVGIDLREVRVVADVEEDIVAAVNALNARFDYVFTTGGIGPTHDDITADAIARAFGVSIDVDPRARAMLLGAERLDADTALMTGMANRIGTMDDAQAWAAEIAGFAPLSLRHSKRVLNDDGAYAEVWPALHKEMFDKAWASQDVIEAQVARVEKRAPNFKGA